MSETKVVIAGSKSIENRKIIYKILDKVISGINPDSILTGGEKGLETIAMEWAEVKDIPVEKRPIQWNDLDVEGAEVDTNKFDKKYNRNAPKIRNRLMLDEASEVVAIWDGSDIGTKILFEYAKRRGIPVKVLIVDGESIESHKVDVQPYPERPKGDQSSSESTGSFNDEPKNSGGESDWSDEIL